METVEVVVRACQFVGCQIPGYKILNEKILNKEPLNSEPFPLLYSFRRCPYAMRARLALYQAQVQVKICEVDLKQKPEAMLKISPKGTVPVLQLPDGRIIDESLALMSWALEQNDPNNWLLKDNTLAESLIAENDGSFKRALDRYKYPQRFADCDFENLSKQARRQAGEFINTLNARLSEASYLSGSNPGFSDIAIFPFIRQFANVDMGWFQKLPLKPLQHWLMGLSESSEFKWVMQKNRALLL